MISDDAKGIVIRRLHTVVTCGALLMFAWLTTRHVGESAFLEDQVDQLQNFESLLHLRPEGLWGAVMSGTAPPARTLGPLGAVVFGLPVALGFGIDSIHMTTSLLIAIATAICFVELARIDVAFAWLWLFVFSATGIVCSAAVVSNRTPPADRSMTLTWGRTSPGPSSGRAARWLAAFDVPAVPPEGRSHGGRRRQKGSLG